MNGVQFYNLLTKRLKSGQLVSGKGNRFIKWLNSEALQFSIPNNNAKSIPKKIIIAAKNAFNQGHKINQKWLIENKCNRGWCLADVLNGLFAIYP